MQKSGTVLFALLSTVAWSQQTSTIPSSLTIYNQNFAVVREVVPLQLKPGENPVSFDNITSYVEPSSVMLRDPAERVHLSILEQNYRSDAVSQYSLLHSFEGKTIAFMVRNGDHDEKVNGKVIRAGAVCVPGTTDMNGAYCYGNNEGQFGQSPIIEIDGTLRFGLPGTPLFPTLGEAALLKPTLNWLLQSDRAAQFNAELSYVTGGLTWEATYNIIIPEKGDALDLIGWVTLQNRSGRTFENAHLQLMAGDVNKIVAPGPPMARVAGGIAGSHGSNERTTSLGDRGGSGRVSPLHVATSIHAAEWRSQTSGIFARVGHSFQARLRLRRLRARCCTISGRPIGSTCRNNERSA